MSDVASLELCKELYELSGRTWHEEIIYSWHKDDGDYVIEDFWTGSTCPAYDLGYLLRKMPPHYLFTFSQYDDGSKWSLMSKESFIADTPEDAACLLAIELFKQGVLK